MSNTSTNSVSSEFISTSSLNECPNSFTQLSQKSFRCCPKCGYSLLHYRQRSNTYRCVHCGEVFSTPVTPPTRSRKCCPECDSVGIYHRNSLNNYICSKCGKVFTVPATKTVRVGGPSKGPQYLASKTTEAV
jgi:Primosomal protein N'' (replication factor Y) - superfamily II helicase